MVACGVHRTIVLVEIAWPNLLARRLIGKQIPIGTRARVRVCSSVGAIAVDRARTPSAVIDIQARLAITAEARRARIARIPGAVCRHVVADDVREARRSNTAIGVIAGSTITAITNAASATVLTWPFVIAQSIVVTVVLIQLARKNLLTRPLSKHIPAIAHTIVRVCSNVGAIAGATWVPSAVVDIQARLSITAEARRARIASEPFRRCWHIVTCHALEARRSSTAIGVVTLRSAPGEAALACAAVTTRTLMAAGRVQCTVVLAPLARTVFLTRSRSKQIAFRAVARVGVCSRISAVAVHGAWIVDTVVDVSACVSIERIAIGT